MTALIAGLYVLALAVELLFEQYMNLVQYGTYLTSYGWGILARILLKATMAGGLFWAFARLGGSKPLPHFARAHSPSGSE